MKIRPSTRADWRRCPRLVFYRHTAAIEPRRPSRALLLGSAYHAGLEAWRLATADWQGAAAHTLTRLLAEAGEEPDPIACVQASVYVAGYVRHFRPHDRDLHLTEVPVFDNDEFDGGTADCVVQNAAGEVWVIEDKTTSRFDSRDATAFALRQNDQIATYVWALRQRGIPVVGARYRQVLKTQTSQTKKETLEDYAARLMGVYTGGDSDQRYREFVVTWTDDELADVRRNAEMTNRQMRLVHPANRDMYPVNPLSCIGPYGACAYLTLCAKGRDESDPRQFKPSAEEPLDEGKYRRQIWGQSVPVPQWGGDRAVAPGIPTEDD